MTKEVDITEIIEFLRTLILLENEAAKNHELYLLYTFVKKHFDKSNEEIKQLFEYTGGLGESD